MNPSRAGRVWSAARSTAIVLAMLLSLGSAMLLTAAGPAQDEKKEPTGAEVYQNLRMDLFRNMPASRVERVMKVVNIVLGVDCTHCHVQDQWERDDLEPEQVKARETMAKMFPMVMAISRDHFDGEGGPTCWTCHRGSTEPQGSPADGWKPHEAPEPSPFVESDEPAGEVYKNLKIFGRMPASRLGRVMGVLTAALDVDCTHCHVEGDWASDEKEPKQTARKMFAMRGAIQNKHFDKDTSISCWTCHRGSSEPEKNPPR